MARRITSRGDAPTPLALRCCIFLAWVMIVFFPTVYGCGLIGKHGASY